MRKPKASSANAAATMRANRAKDTLPEKALRAALRARGWRGYRLNVRSLPGSPEIVFGRQKVAIFVHGCFWHRCPKCRPALPAKNREFWREKFRANCRRDESNCRQLVAAGWDTLEIWECEIHADAPRLCSRDRSATE